jgi:methylenetetrahydrofolate dehydrogenase (NADP+)/methenyltetrahydrofolate cyclohydrolase
MIKPLILDGRQTREALLPKLIGQIRALGFAPTLAIIQVSDRPDSAAFIRAKTALAKKIGVKIVHVHKPESISERDLVTAVEQCNADRSIHAIIVQMPLPLGINKDAVIDTIDPSKDADGLTAVNVKRWLEGRQDAVMPATARGIRTLLRHYDIELFGKKVAVVGRSMLVGKPVIALCLNENATVIACHSKTPDLAEKTRDADIIIVAAGRPGLIGADHVRAGQTVIDVGINRTERGGLTGDVDFAAVEGLVAAITPVPGGVGPLTVLSLFENVADLCSR